MITIIFIDVLSSNFYFIYLVLLVNYALFFSLLEHPDTILDNLELETSHHLICHSKTKIRNRDDRPTASSMGFGATTTTTCWSLGVLGVEVDDDDVMELVLET